MNRKIIGGFLMVIGIICLCLTVPKELKSKTLHTNPVEWQEKKEALVELIRKWEAKYNVLFTYDRRIVESVEVETPDPEVGNIEKALAYALQKTELKYTILEDRYVILYKNNREGIKSLKNMVEHLSKIINNENKKFTGRNAKTVDRLYTHAALDLYLKRMVMNITGTVTDESGEPLIGVNLQVKGTNKGTATDFDGKFTLEDIDEKAVLVVSYVGYQTQEVLVAGKSNLTITLISDSQLLDEVVVVGYGTVKKSDLTGSVARIDGENFNMQSLTQISEMLQGTVAGFRSSQGASASGGGSLEIRGPTSLSAGTEPLIVLDDVIYNGSIRDINPADVASIDILKDASAAAVYGAKAASGVVLITTVKGRIGVPKFNFSSKVGLAEDSHPVREFGPGDFEEFRGQYLRKLNVELPDSYYFSPNNLPDGISVDEWLSFAPNPNSDPTTEWLGRLQLASNEIKNYQEGKTISWYDEIVQKGLRQKYDLSVNGGSEKFKYYTSLGYTDNEGIRYGDQYSVITSRLNISSDIATFLSVGINSNLAYRDESDVPANMNFSSSPYGDKFEEDGTTLRWYTNGMTNTTNPLINAYNQQRERKRYNFVSSIFAHVDLPFDIKYKLVYQPRFGFSKNYNYYPKTTLEGGRDRQDGYGTREDSHDFEWLVNNLLTWNKQVGIHNFDFTFLFSAEKYQSWTSIQIGENFAPNELLGFHSIQSGSVVSVNSDDVYSTGNAFMGRLNYSLLDKYLLTASIRQDGYSAFGSENKTAVFPAAALAWQVSREDFWNEDWTLSRLKFRLSWGVNGNRDIGRYSTLARLGQNLYFDGSGTQIGLYNNSLANNSLVWEETSAFNVGFDIGLFNNRIDISSDIYQSTTNNLLMLRRLPQIIGYDDVISNLGQLENKGFELTVNTINIDNSNFHWRTNFVFSLNRNKIIKLFGDTGEYVVEGESINGELPDFTNGWFPGQAVDVIWDYKQTGIWQLDEVDDAARYNQGPGDYKAEDVNNDGIYTEPDDKQFIGNYDPQYLIGFRNEVTFLNNFSASLFVRAELGHIGSIDFHKHPGAYERTNYREINYWTPENPTNKYTSLNPFTQLFSGGYNVYFNRSFVRIQDFTLAYNVPFDKIGRIGLDQLKIFGNIRNLLTFTEWEEADPESGNNPMPRIFTLGLDLAF